MSTVIFDQARDVRIDVVRPDRGAGAFTQCLHCGRNAASEAHVLIRSFTEMAEKPPPWTVDAYHAECVPWHLEEHMDRIVAYVALRDWTANLSRREFDHLV